VNKESVDARRIKDPSSVNNGEQSPGDFAWEFDFTHFPHGAKPEDVQLTLYFCLPGESRWSPIHVQRGQPHPDPETRIWGWDGDFDKPTVVPSINWVDHWHGYLTAGRFISEP
jgi:hypothetical protein